MEYGRRYSVHHNYFQRGIEHQILQHVLDIIIHQDFTLGLTREGRLCEKSYHHFWTRGKLIMSLIVYRSNRPSMLHY